MLDVTINESLTTYRFYILCVALDDWQHKGNEGNRLPHKGNIMFQGWAGMGPMLNGVVRSMGSIPTPSSHINPSPPSAAYMRQWIRSALVQIMVVAYKAPSYYMNQCWFIVNWTFWNKFQLNFNQNTKLYIHENASDNIVCDYWSFTRQDFSYSRLLGVQKW